MADRPAVGAGVVLPVGIRDAVVVVVDQVVLDPRAVGHRDADVVGAEVAVDLVARDQREAAGSDATVGVVVHLVAGDVAQHRRTGAVGVDAPGAVAVDVGRVDQGITSPQEQTGVGVVVHCAAAQREAVVAGLQVDAVTCMAVDPAVLHGDAVAVAAGVAPHAVLCTGQAEVAQQHVIGAVQLDHHRPGIGIAAVEHGLVAGQLCALDGNARVLRAEHHVGGQAVAAAVDGDHVARVQVVGAQQRGQAGHRPVRVLARVGVVAHGRAVLVAHQAGVVDVVARARVGHQEALIAVVAGAHRPAGRVDRGDQTQLGRVAHGFGVGRPGRLPAPEAVQPQPGGHRRPARAVVGGGLQLQARVGHAAGVHPPQLDAAEHRGVIGRLVDQLQLEPLPARDVDVDRQRHRLVDGAGQRAHVYVGGDHRAVGHDVELARTHRDVAGLHQVQHQLLRAVGRVDLVAQFGAHAAGRVGVAAHHGIGRARRQRADVHGRGHGDVAVVVLVAVGAVARPLPAPVVHANGVGLPRIEQQHAVIGQQPRAAPAHRGGHAHFELLQPVGRQQLHHRVGAGVGLDRVAVGAQVDAVAVGPWLAQAAAVGITAVDGRRAVLQVQVVVDPEVARQALDPHRVGRHDAVGQVVQHHAQARPFELDQAQHAPVAAVCRHPAGRVGVLVDHVRADHLGAVVDAVVAVAAVDRGVVVLVRPGGHHAVVARAQPVKGPARLAAAVAGNAGAHVAPARVGAAADALRGPRAHGGKRHIAVVHDPGAAGHGCPVPADHVVDAVHIDEARIGGHAVAVLPDLVEPVGAVGKRPVLPVPQPRRRAQHEQVVVRAEVLLAVAGHVQRIAGTALLEDVVADQHVAAAALDQQRVGRGAHDGVVLHPRAQAGLVGPVELHPRPGVGLDHVVVDPVVVAGDVDARTSVAVHPVAQHFHAIDHRDAGGVGPHPVVLDLVAVVAVDARGIAPHQVVVHPHTAVVRRDARGLAPDFVVTDLGLVVALDARARAVVKHPVARHHRPVGIALVHAGVQPVAVRVHLVVEQARARPAGFHRPAAVARNLVALDQRVRPRHVHPALSVVFDQVSADDQKVVRRLQVNATVRVVPDPAVHHRQPVAVLVVGRVDAVHAALQLQIAQAHVGGAAELHHHRPGIGIAAVEHGLVAGQLCALDGNARVLRAEHHVGGQAVAAAVDGDHVARVQVVGAQQRGQAGHRPVRVLARVGVVAHGRAVLVAHQAGVVDVVARARVGHQEALIAVVAGAHRPAGRVDRGDQTQLGRVAHGFGVGRPGRLPAPEAVQPQPGGHRRPARAVVGGGLQLQARVGHAAGVHPPQLDAAEHRGVIGRLVDQLQLEPLPARDVDVDRQRHRLVDGAGQRAHVYVGGDHRAVGHDVELARTHRDVAGLHQVQHQLLRAVGRVDLVAQFGAHAAGRVGVAAHHGIGRARRQRADVHGRGHGDVAVVVLVAVGAVARPLPAPVVHANGVGLPRIEQQHAVIGQQPRAAPAHRGGHAHFELLQPVGRQQLHHRVGAGVGLDRVAVGAQVDAVAVGPWLAQAAAVGITAVDGRRAVLQVQVVVDPEVARQALDPHRVGRHDAVGQVVQHHAQARPFELDQAQHAPVAAVCRHPAGRVGVLVDHVRADHLGAVVDAVVAVAAVDRGVVVLVRPGGHHAVVARAQPVKGPARLAAAVAGNAGAHVAPARVGAAADALRGPRAHGGKRHIAVVHDPGAAGHGCPVPADHVVDAVHIDEARIGGHAVAVLPDLVEPVGAVGKRPVLPVPQPRRRAQHEQVVVRAEVLLAVAGHVQRIAGTALLEDVVADQHVAAAALDQQRVGRGAHDGVVLHPRAQAGLVGPVELHPRPGVGLDHVVVDPVVVAGDVDARTSVAVHPVAQHFHAIDHRDAGGVGPHPVVLDLVAVVAVDARGIAPHQVVVHPHTAVVRRDARGLAPDFVVTDLGLVVALDARARAVVKHPVARHHRPVGIALVHAGVQPVAVRVHLVVEQARARPAGFHRPAAVARNLVALDQRVRPRHVHPALSVVFDQVSADDQKVVRRLQVNATVRVVPDPAVHHRQPVAVLVVGRVDAVHAASDLQAVERDAVRPLELEHHRTGVGIAAVEHRVVGLGAADRRAAVVDLDEDVGAQRVAPGVDQHHIARLQVVGIEDAAHRRLGQVG